MGRLNEIFSVITPCDVIADIGCDHGYISKMIAKSGIAQLIVMTDISAKCLKKAEDLLKEEVEQGKAVSFVSDGLTGVEIHIDEAVIAGMGGEETVKILSDRSRYEKVSKLVLQPMKNADKVRKYLLDNGYKIERDYTFYDAGKFYELIVAKISDVADYYTDLELEFGRENLLEKGEAFIKKYKKEINSIKERLKVSTLSEKTRREFLSTISKYEKVIE